MNINMNIKEIEECGEILMETITCGKYIKEIDLEMIIMNFINAVNNNEFSSAKKCEEYKTIDTHELTLMVCEIINILNEEFNIWIVQKEIQQMKKTNFAHILSEISKEHTHKFMKNGTEYACPHYESLGTHLLTAMTIMFACTNDVESDVRLSLCTTALLHDIGKYRTAGMTYGKHNYSQYPFHGELGAGILLQAWTLDGMGKYFNKETWEEMSRTVSMHMCGYSENDASREQTQFKWNLLANESGNVKNMLFYMSMADRFGTIKTDGESEGRNNDDKFKNSREEFKNSLTCKCDHSKYTKNGMCIMLCGMSAAGKSTLVEKIIETCDSVKKDMCVVIDRDLIMTQVVSEHLQIETKPTVKASGKQYAEFREVYERHKLNTTVNKIMKEDIDIGIKNGKIVILDTMMNLFGSLNKVLPKNFKKTFKISIHPVRNEIMTQKDADRLGITVEKQLNIFGSRDEFCWLTSSLMGESRYETSKLKILAPITTVRDMDNAKESAKPTLTFVVTWDLGKTDMLRQIKQYAETMTDRKITVKEKEEHIDGRLLEQNVWTDDMNIAEYVNYMYKKSKGKIKQITKKLTSLHFMAKYSEEDKILKIKYYEFCRLWKPKWARECRGCVLRLSNETNKFVCDKMLLQRGTEILTGMQLEENLESNMDVNINEDEKIDYRKDKCMFDEFQQNTIQLLSCKESQPINGALSFKNDGSLLGITLYGKDTEAYSYYTNKIESQENNKLGKLMLKISKDLSFIPVISSQGTVYLGDNMMSYMMTSIASSINIPGIDNDQQKFTEIVNAGKSEDLVYVFEKYVAEHLLSKLKSFYEKMIYFGNSEEEEIKKHEIIMCLSFEAICKKRRCSWGTTHPELAISYPQAKLNCLGCTFINTVIRNNTGFYIPHYQIEKEISECGFTQPIWWEINNTKMIETMTSDLSKVIKNTITSKEYYEKYKPSNLDFNIKAHDNYLDYEGFVFYRNKHEEQHCKYMEVDYSKIKTAEYYISHKFKHSNIEELLLLNETSSHIFPLVKTVSKHNNNIEERLLNFTEKISSLLLEPNEKNVLFNSLPEKAKNKYNSYDIDTQMKILINSSQKRDEIFIIFKNVFDEFKDILILPSKIKSLALSLIMHIEPWKDMNNDVIRTMIDTKNTSLLNLLSEITKIM
jgi:hypothetical protein